MSLLHLSGGRQSDITVHQLSTIVQRPPREMIPIIGQSIFRREINDVKLVTRLFVHLRRDRIEITVGTIAPVDIRGSNLRLIQGPCRSPFQFVADFSEPPARLTIRLADLVVTE